VDDVVAALAAQQQELERVLAGLSDADWRAPTPCEGWDVSDVVLHLVQSDEVAIGSLTGRFAEVVAELADGGGSSSGGASSIDEGAARLVEKQRGSTPDVLRARWTAGAVRLRDELRTMDLSTRVTWVAGELSARTLATTRMTETWIHTGDIAEAVGVTVPPTDRLRLTARLAWRTLPYAFSLAGLVLDGPVAFLLQGPDGQQWDFVPEEAVVTTVSGPATDLCAVAGRRVHPSATSLVGEGPDADRVLALMRTYA
jgi:uncharacterized protein (TIGR03084 family)